MRVATALLLTRPGAAAERGRFRLVTGSVAVAGGLLLAGQRVATLGLESNGTSPAFGPMVPDPAGGLAPYVAEPGLRPGVVIGAALLTVPVLALAVQAIRVGSLARERRMASLRLAGATPGDVRTVAAAEAGAAAAAGGLLAGPVYLLLWLGLGALVPEGMRLVPTPGPLDLLAWATTLLLTTTGGAVAGAVVQGRVAVDPLGVRRRARPRPPGVANLFGLAVGLLLVGSGPWLMTQAEVRGGYLPVVVVLLGLLLVAFTIGPRLVRRRGWSLQQQGSAVDLLAGARLHADPRAPGRVAAVLVVCGLALGLETVLVVGLLRQDSDQLGGDLAFYLTGYGLAAGGVVVSIVVAVLTLVVGGADQLLDARRPLASLVALGVDERVLGQVLRRQQSAVAVPAVVLGVVVGGAGVAYLGGALAGAIVPTLLVAAAAATAVSWATGLTAALLRSRLRAATDPENLRVA